MVTPMPKPDADSTPTQDTAGSTPTRSAADSPPARSAASGTPTRSVAVERLRSPAELERWLVARVAFYVRRPAAEIGVDTPLADYGLDSLYAFSLWGEIEDTLEIEIDPSILWELPTAAGLAEHIAALLAAR
jgi:acyl carrier protein